MRGIPDAEFEEFVRGHRGELVATATLLSAGDPHLAEDLVQTALTRLYLAWRRARSTHVPAYSRRILVNCFVDHRRRPWVRREHSTDTLPDGPSGSPPGDPVDQPDDALLGALRDLPPRMRAAVVLRHVEDLSVAEVADALGCSSGTVKSQTARGLDKLRAALAQPTSPGGPDDRSH